MDELKPEILLCAVNANYQHCAFGIRYLKSNLQELESRSQIIEFTIKQKTELILEKIISLKPKILGIGVYIWNTNHVLALIKALKTEAPHIKIILGGPEISYQTQEQDHVNFCDYVICGEADLAFYELCTKLLNHDFPSEKIIQSSIPDIQKIKLPYYLYTDEDIKNRSIYVEASRGCPYRCEYCLSSLDKSVRNFQIDLFISELNFLLQRGARNFKFVDRTFNLNTQICRQILNFFLEHINLGLFLHFEMVPDRLPEEIQDLLVKFPEGSLQFEIGIQTWNPIVAANVSRRQNYEKIKQNFSFLKTKTKIHTHADLIIGLPGESKKSFADGFDALLQCEPDEIQVGILKLLRGTPIVRHRETFSMLYSSKPPYEIIKTKDISEEEMKELAHFAKFWDLLANRGQFNTSIKTIKQSCELESVSYFNRFFNISNFFFSRHQRTFGIQLSHLAESLFLYLTQHLQMDITSAAELIYHDYCLRGKRHTPKFLYSYINHHKQFQNFKMSKDPAGVNKRQLRHIID